MNAPPMFQAVSGDLLRLRPALARYWRSWLACVGVFLLWRSEKQIFDGLMELFGIPLEMSVLGLGIGLAPILAGVAFHHFTHAFEIERGRLLRCRVGFVAQESREFALSERVQIDVARSVAGRLLGFGTVTFWTGDDMSRLAWTDVADPEEVRRYVNWLRSPEQRAAAEPAPAVARATEPAPSLRTPPQAALARAPMPQPRARAPSASPQRGPISTTVGSSPLSEEERAFRQRRIRNDAEKMKLGLGMQPDFTEDGATLLRQERIVYVPLAVPTINVTSMLFEGRGIEWDDPNYAHRFRIERWLKRAGDWVTKNEPVAIVAGSPLAEHPYFASLNLRAPAILAPESGRLCWISPLDPPQQVFGVIETTVGAIVQNLGVPFRSELIPYVEQLMERFRAASILRRMQIVRSDPRLEHVVVLEDAIKAALQDPEFQCHLRESWKDSDPFVQVFERQGEWPRIERRLREWKVDLAKLGLELENG